MPTSPPPPRRLRAPGPRPRRSRPSRSAATLTPVASRPWEEMSLTPVRMILPAEENTRISSSGCTMNAATTPTRLAVTFMPRTPWPPRPWRLNRSSLVRLPWPLALTNSITESSWATSQETTASSAFLSFMPRTPAVGPAHRPDVGLREADRHPVARHHEDVVVAGGLDHPHELVVGLEVDRDEPGAQRRVVLATSSSSSPGRASVAKNRYAPSS